MGAVRVLVGVAGPLTMPVGPHATVALVAMPAVVEGLAKIGTVVRIRGLPVIGVPVLGGRRAKIGLVVRVRALAVNGVSARGEGRAKIGTVVRVREMAVVGTRARLETPVVIETSALVRTSVRISEVGLVGAPAMVGTRTGTAAPVVVKTRAVTGTPLRDGLAPRAVAERIEIAATLATATTRLSVVRRAHHARLLVAKHRARAVRRFRPTSLAQSCRARHRPNFERRPKEQPISRGATLSWRAAHSTMTPSSPTSTRLRRAGYCRGWRLCGRR